MSFFTVVSYGISFCSLFLLLLRSFHAVFPLKREKVFLQVETYLEFEGGRKKHDHGEAKGGRRTRRGGRIRSRGEKKKRVVIQKEKRRGTGVCVHRGVYTHLKQR